MQLLINKLKFLKKNKVSPEKLAIYLRLYNSLYEDLQLEALSEATLKRIMLAKPPREEKDITNLDSAIDKIFPFDWQERVVKEGHETELELLLHRISKLHNGSKRRINIQIGDDIAAPFEGIYLGITKFDEDSNPTPYLMTVDMFGNVEIVSVKNYHRTGYLISKSSLVYFQLDTVTGFEPELYVSKIDRDFRKAMVHVDEFKMCGVWVTREGEPVFGSTLLIKQKKASYVNRSVIDVRGILPLLDDNFFSNLSKTEEFRVLIDRSLEEKLNVYFLTRLTTDPKKRFVKWNQR